MNKYYIQFATDFHLLAALAAIDDVMKSAVVFVGPQTSMSLLLAEKISAELVIADPRKPRITLGEILALTLRSRHCKRCIIISPFVFPFYTFKHLLEAGCCATKIVRTDEGVGSYASVGHFYTSLKLANPAKSSFHCAAIAVAKKTAIWATKLCRICNENYIFREDLSVRQDGVARLRRNISLVGRLDGLNDKAVYVSQPGVLGSFDSPEEYVAFIRRVGKSVGRGNVIVKKHPSDGFDYSKHGLAVVEGYPLELYRLEDSVVFGFSSTALLIAKITNSCEFVYYIKMPGVGPFYSALSPMNKRLFDRYLEPLNYTR